MCLGAETAARELGRISLDDALTALVAQRRRSGGRLGLALRKGRRLSSPISSDGVLMHGSAGADRIVQRGLGRLHT
jgi:hypothetical protein